ncbi:hypothetical protein JW916_09270 [Candidatus Sumerlaeota bacterium]|nr:hypothetical protein [Candidatus Sumerlaeota bacterium]
MGDSAPAQKKNGETPGAENPSASWRRGSLVPCTVIAAVALSLALFVHVVAGDQFPVPWADECDFLWPSIAFAREGTLLSPVLNPERPILWMPPGYMVFTGTVFKVFGFSLGLARWISFVCVALGFVGLIGLAADLGRAGASEGVKIPENLGPLVGSLAAVLCACFFLGSPFVVAGNIGRMEAPILALAVAALVFLRVDRPYPATAVALAMPLVHPNGMLFVLAIAVWWMVSPRFGCRRRLPRSWEWLFLAIVAFLWLLYLVYALRYWSAFRHDMAYQFLRKKREIVTLEALLGWWSLVSAGLFVLCAAWGWRARDRRSIQFLVVAVPAWLVWRVGQEMWYEVFGSLALLLLSMALLRLATASLGHAFVKRLGALSPQSPLSASRWIPVGVTLALLTWHLKAERIPTPWDYPWNGRWFMMRIEPGGAYATPEDLAWVRGFLERLPMPDRALPTVEFCPRADSLLFADLEGRRIRISQPVFCQGSPDAFVIHMSHHRPIASWENAIYNDAFRRAGITRGRSRHLLRTRGRFEEWYGAVRPTLAAR